MLGCRNLGKGGSHLPQSSNVVLHPRKLPVQARSSASVNAILEATVQVLLDLGKERLTTTRVAATVERVCREHQCHTLRQMATALVTAFLQAKMKDIRTSVALYAVSSDIDGAKIVRHMGRRSNRAI